MPEPLPSLPPHTIIIQQPSVLRRLVTWILAVCLAISLVFNITQFLALAEYASSDGTTEKFHSGNLISKDKLAIVELSGTIMPPFTERILATLKHIEEDEAVKGVVLAIDSPGGLVADSHQIYHRLQQLRERRKLPIYVAMKRIAASGGYYVAMGAGPDARIYAEPTTWTGSIGVIIPRYDVSKLASEFGVSSEPLTTGPFKDSLSPFRELTPEERGVWEGVLQDAFERFQQVIATGRANLDAEKIRAVATGQVFTANQALEHGLIDEIGYQEDALEALKRQTGLKDPRIVEFEHPLTLADLLFGSVRAREKADPLQPLLEAGVPRAMYFCGWNAGMVRE
jgi:protease-4